MSEEVTAEEVVELLDGALERMVPQQRQTFVGWFADRFCLACGETVEDCSCVVAEEEEEV